MPSHPIHDENLATPELSPKEEREAEKRVAVTALVVHEAIRKQGDEELARPASALAWSGWAAGLTMSFSLIAEGLIRAGLPDSRWRNMVVTLGYPLGYLIVIIGRQQLFTENTLTAVLPLLARRDRLSFYRMLRLWIVVLAANLVGAHMAAWTLANTHMFEPEVSDAFAAISQSALSVSPGLALLKGIFAGWLIAMVVWMLASARGGHIAIIGILTYVVGLAHFTHVVAGSVEALYSVMIGAHPWTDWAAGYFLPTLLGNILGGVSLVSLLNHAQVVAGQER